MLEKLNQRLLSRSDCGSTMAGIAGEGREEDDEGMSKSANVEKSIESKTKGEGSSGLSSNMVGVSKVEVFPGSAHAGGA